MAGSTWTDFAPLTKPRAARMNENFDWLEGHRWPMLDGSTTTGVFDWGAVTAQWRDAYFGGTIKFQESNAQHLNMVGPGKGTSGQGVFGFGNSTGTNGIGFRQDSDGSLFVDSYNAGWNWSTKFHLVNRTMEFLSGAALDAFDANTALLANSDSRAATEKAVKAYVDAAHTPSFSGFTPTISGGFATVTAAALGIDDLGANVLLLASFQAEVVANASGTVQIFFTIKHAGVAAGNPGIPGGGAYFEIHMMDSSVTVQMPIFIFGVDQTGNSSTTNYEVAYNLVQGSKATFTALSFTHLRL